MLIYSVRCFIEGRESFFFAYAKRISERIKLKQILPVCSSILHSSTSRYSQERLITFLLLQEMTQLQFNCFQ